MKQFIFIFLLFISYVAVNAIDDANVAAVIDAKEGDKISDEHPILVPARDVVKNDATKVATAPSETNAGRPLVLDKPDISPTTVPSKSGLPSENVSPANSKDEAAALATEKPVGEVTTVKAKVSAESDESKEKQDETLTTKIPTETVAVAKKKPGEDTKVATATKVENVAVEGNPEKENLPTVSSPSKRARRDVEEDSAREVGDDSTFTLIEADDRRDPRSISMEDGNVQGMGGVGGQGMGTPIGGVNSGIVPNVDGTGGVQSGGVIPVALDDPLPVSSESREKTNLDERLTRSAESKSSESKEKEKEKEDEETKTFSTKIPEEAIAVVHKKVGEKAEVQTATTASIVEVKEKTEKTRAKRVPDSSSSESHEVLQTGNGSPGLIANPGLVSNSGLPVVNSGNINPPAGLGAGPLRQRRGTSKSSESKESGEEKKADEGKDSFTTKVPIESVAIAKKKIGEDEPTKVATATKLKNVEVEGNPEKENLPTVPTPSKRLRRHVEPNSASSESAEASGGAQSPSSPAIEKTEVHEAVDAKTVDPKPEVGVVAKGTIPVRSRRESEKAPHKPGPSEGDMAAGDPAKLEAKPQSRARRYA